MLKESNVDGVRRVYLYTPADERLAAITMVGSTQTQSEWTVRGLDGRVLRRFHKIGSAWNWAEDYVYREGALLAAEVAGSARSLHFHLDHLGSPRLITGSGGAEISRHTYYPFGREATAWTDGEHMKFTGHERDGNNLDYMHARYYMPFGGRFLTVDPEGDVSVESTQSWNRYTYVRDDPMNATDPSGGVAITTFTGSIEVAAAHFLFDAVWDPFRSRAGHWGSNAITRFDLMNGRVEELLFQRNAQLESANRGRAIRGELQFLSFDQCRAHQQCFEWDDMPLMVGGVRRSAFDRAARLRLLGGAAYNAQQQALIELAQKAAKTGVTKEQAMILIKWAREYKIPYQNHIYRVSRTGKPNHHLGGVPHIRIGSVNHIHVKN
jgi:RHS repeat-associated protein